MNLFKKNEIASPNHVTMSKRQTRPGLGARLPRAAFTTYLSGIAVDSWFGCVLGYMVGGFYVGLFSLKNDYFKFSAP